MRNVFSLIARKFLVVLTALLLLLAAWAPIAQPVSAAPELNPRVGSVTVAAQVGTLTYGTPGSVTYQVTINRGTGGGSGGAFNADVSVNGLAAGAAATWSQDPVPFTNGQNSRTVTLTITTNATTPAGADAFTVQAQSTTDNRDTATANTTLTVGKANSTTTITSDNPDPSVIGQTVAVNFTVTGAGGPTGNVTVSDGTVSCTATAAAGTCNLTFTTTGAKTLTAAYAGSANHNSSTSANVTHTVNPANTTTTLTTSPNPSGLGQAVTLTTTVATAGSGTPAGTVTFYVDGTSAGTATLAGGAAAFSLSTLTVGSHPIYAVYSGGTGYNGSTSATLTQVVKNASTTTLTAAPNPSVPAQSVTLTATVSSAGGSPTGSVTFTDGATVLGNNIPLAGNTATLTVPLAAGSHTITAAYNGDANFSVSSATVTQMVDGTAPNTTITGSPADPTNDNTPTYTFSGTDNITPAGSLIFECSLDSTTTFTPCASPLTLPAVSDGSHTFRVRAVDQVGNRDASPAADTWVTDTVPPDTRIVNDPGNPANSTTAYFDFAASDTGTGVGTTGYQCALDGGAFSGCNNLIGKIYTGLSQGSHTFQVRAQDDAGNIDPTPATFTWVVDTANPTVVSSTRANPNPTNAASVQFTVTFSESVTGVDAADFSLTNTGLTGTSVTSVAGSGAAYTVTVNTGTGSGTLRLNVVDNDSIRDTASNRLGGTGNNNGNYNAGEAYTVDKTAPNTTLTGTPTNPSGAAVNFTFSGTDNVTPAASLTFECALDGAAFAACTSPQTYTGLASASHTFQVRAIDQVGNVDGSPAAYTWVVDADMPAVSSITRVDANPSNAASVSFTVTFSEPVTGVDTADFALTTTGLTGAGITSVTPVSGTVYTVSVDTGTGSGSLRLDVSADPLIQDNVNNFLVGPYTGGETYTIDKDAPTVNITRASANPTNAASVDFTVTFNEAVTGVDTADFALDMTGGVSGAVITALTPVSTSVYTVSASTGAGDGTLRLDIVAAPTIQDQATNLFVGPYTIGESYLVDKTTPRVDITRAGTNPTNATSVDFTVTFSKDVTGVDITDFTLTATGLTNVSISAFTPVSASVYTVTASTGTGSGTLRLDLIAAPAIQDGAGNSVAAPYTTGQVYNVDKAIPTVSIKRGSAAGYNGSTSMSPTNATSVDFTVTFNKDVTGIDAADFGLTATGITGASITTVTQVSASVYDITVNTGSGNGTLRLDILSTATIQDLANNPLSGPFTDGESYTIDKLSPYVAVNGVTGYPESKLITEGATYFTFFSSFTITFNKDLNNPAGSTDPHDVTNPANYLLLSAGRNRTFDTVSCQSVAQSGKLGGDDIQVTVGPVTYNPATFTTTLTVNGAQPLAEGLYQLLVCGTTSIADPAGNKLNSGQRDTALTFNLEHAPSELPATGFAPHQVTVLPAQPASKAYADLGSLWLEIPRLGVQAPIVGVPAEEGWDVSWLNGSVGWLDGTSYPTLKGNSVLTGHVYDANGQPSVFARLNQLSYGEKIVIHNGNQAYTYEVRTVSQLAPNAVAGLLKAEDYTWVTLVTCRGYDQKSNSYQYRVAVRAVLVSVK